MESEQKASHENLKFQILFGVNLTFDYICGRDYYNNNNNINKENDIQKNEYQHEKIKQTLHQTNKKDNIIDNTITDNTKINNNKLDNNINENFKKKKDIDLNDIDNFGLLIEKIKNFNGCDLKFGAKNSVIFDGNKNAKIMLIGEAPGENEDEKGVPFCGQSGQLLRKALDFIELNTTNMLITNTVYWRPPLNRKPDEKELSICFPFVKKMIEIIKPKIVILCGSTAIKLFLNSSENMGKITGNIKKIGVKNNNYFIFNNDEKVDNINCDYCFSTFAIYHPSYLLRNPSMKKIFWRHLLKLKNILIEMKI